MSTLSLWARIKAFFAPKVVAVTKPAPAPSRPVELPVMSGWFGVPDDLKEYEAMLADARVDKYSAQVDAAALKIIKNKDQFQAGVIGTTVPWWWVALTMFRENSVNMNCQILNGQKFTQRTTIVPAGHGPWKTWVESTQYGLKYKKLDKLQDWSMGAALYRWEQWNGMGYKKRNLRSPYLWGGTNLQQPGMYVSDGRFSTTVYDPRPGCVAVLIRLKEMGHIA